MDVMVLGRGCQIPEDFEDYANQKISSVAKFKDRIRRVEVQVSTHNNSKTGAVCTCEITLLAKGPVVRATGDAEEKRAAFDEAFDRLKAQLRRAADRRKTSKKGHLRGNGLAAEMIAELSAIQEHPEVEPLEAGGPGRKVAGDVHMQGDGPLVVREKVFEATPLTLAQALDEMELVGHDFFLYVDAETSRPSVVYRRRAYDYGVIHLDVHEESSS